MTNEGFDAAMRFQRRATQQQGRVENTSTAGASGVSSGHFRRKMGREYREYRRLTGSEQSVGYSAKHVRHTSVTPKGNFPLPPPSLIHDLVGL